jgi:CDP-diacylglycerol--glycerol-3-phosphate 3-phosphatidyltransferase
VSEIKAFGPTALLTPANGLTVGRLIAAPAFAVIVARYGPGSWVLFAVWTVLAFSDGLDGRVARWHGTTRSGAFLDPLADKFLVVATLGALVSLDVIALWPVVVIAAREIAVSVFRVFAARSGVSVPARPLAKMKTLVQDVAIASAFVPLIGDHHHGVAQVLLDIAVFLTVASGLEYALDGRRLIREGRSVEVTEPTHSSSSAV